MQYRDGLSKNDLLTLRGIIRGPGTYPTPSPARIERLRQMGLIKKVKAQLRPTLKGRLVALLAKA